jgi:hypothetical protein
VRAFAGSAKVSHRGCSRPLQRAVTDFGADQSFAQVMDKLVEHYGIVLGESTIRRITEGHARQIHANYGLLQAAPRSESSAVVIVEMDGGMVPLVESDVSCADRRKGKKLLWKEAKLCLAHPQGSKTLAYGGTLQGDVRVAGRQLADCAARAGFGARTEVHAVGDGAPWIADQVDDQFGAQGRYLLDFYHVCDYLSAAAKRIVSDAAQQQAWMEEQKERLKTRRAGEILLILRRHLEAEEVNDSDAPVRQCHRYLSQRREQLHYQEALARELPIGSGEIESAHRYIVQQRLKRPGAWWQAANAEHMLALRLNRANRQWNGYWATESKQAA